MDEVIVTLHCIMEPDGSKRTTLHGVFLGTVEEVIAELRSEFPNGEWAPKTWAYVLEPWRERIDIEFSPLRRASAPLN